MQPYDHSKIEKKWQKAWASKKLFKTRTKTDKKKFYILDMFPYPSGEGLHVGHPKGYIATDVVSRMKRMQGYEVLHPMGFDAFGLPAENYAIKTKTNPVDSVKKNVARYKKQLEILGFDYDWSREINTTDPKYYAWTQWIFLQLFKKGLAYEANEPINWCPKDKTGLANEDVEDGKCERCGTPVEKKLMRQWVLKITDYADRLLSDLDLVDINGMPLLDWPASIKELQRNWIGRSEGAEIDFAIAGKEQKIRIFTTRPDTLFGVTYIVLAPESKLVDVLLPSIQNRKEVENYITRSKAQTEIDRTDAKKEKSGVELDGVFAINPANNEQIPIWIADYVLADYGTGAVMAVPAHDERDFSFAKKYKLPIRQVIAPLFENTTDLIPKKDLLMIRRRIIHAIVKHPTENKYLVIKWKKEGWGSMITGGIEEGEDVVAAAQREILEETGYKNVEHVAASGSAWEAHSSFYASHKNENRYMIARGIVFRLKDEERVDIAQEEKDKHELMWVEADRVRDFLTHVNQKLVWDYCTSGERAFTDSGSLINSGQFSDKQSDEAKKGIIEYVHGKWVTTYRLRPWVFSRQRYWGEPIPIIHCDKCGAVPVPEKNLPVKLPKVKFYEPTDTGESPLANISKWVNVKCPKCKGAGRRETNTMPQWAGSSWYHLRYIDPKNKKALVDKEAEKFWSPVDLYVGGAEHATRHLIYARFWHKFLYDIGTVATNEPFKKLQHVGLIMAEDGRKMSKRYGNVVNPDEIVKNIGADSLRVYEMFMGPFDQAISWSTNNAVGARRFIERVWRLREKVTGAPIIATGNSSATDATLHKTIKKVTEDIEAMRFNTAISSLMILVNELEKESAVSHETYDSLLKLVAPFAPHITDELWASLKHKGSIHISEWPVFDPSKIQESSVEIVVQVNGKIRATFTAQATADDNSLKNEALNLPDVKKWIADKPIKKVIIIKGRLVNIVI